MSIDQLTKTEERSIVSLFTIVILFLLHSSVIAQKAPEYSNDFLMDNKTRVFFMTDRLEFYNVDGNPLILDAQGYIGKDLRKFWFEVEGEAMTTEKEGEIELEGLYSWAISPFFDMRAGIRYDIAYHREETRSRAFAVIGVQGLAPYLFEIDGNLFISQDGDVSAEVEGEYDFPITQRLWGQPRVATSVAVQEVPQWGVGSGFKDIQLGFRLRYEIKRELAPYVGISWNRKL